MDVASVVISILRAANSLLERCEEAKQCHVEIRRLELRLHNLIGTLHGATKGSEEDLDIQRKLVELHRFVGTLIPVLERCKKPSKTLDEALKSSRRSDLASFLRVSEVTLLTLCTDLGLTMLPEIGNLLDWLSHESEASTSELVQELMQEQQLKTQEFLEGALGDLERTVISSTPEGSTGSLHGSAGSLHGSICWDELAMNEDDILGEGSFGVVLAGSYFTRNVAVKKATQAHLPRHIAEGLRRESELHFAMHHPNIVEVLAFSIAPPVCMVMERMDETLYDCIHSGIQLSLHTKLLLLVGVTKGLEYLHALGIIHMDINSLSVLVDADLTVAKLSDFGLARAVSTVESEIWMAPEMFSPSARPSFEADVFSLSVVMYEVMMQHTPEHGRPLGLCLYENKNERLVVEGVVGAKRMQKIVEPCASREPSRRPKASEVLLDLRKVEDTCSPEGDAESEADANEEEACLDSSQAMEEEILVKDLEKSSTHYALEDVTLAEEDRDKAVLTIFFQECGGPSWLKNEYWGTDELMKRWWGIRTTDEPNGRVQVINLNNMGVSGTIPPILGRLTALTHIALGSCKLTGPVPPELGQLKALKHIGLSGNNLTGPIPPELGLLTNLEWMDLEYNKLTGSIPPELGRLTRVVALRLSNNQLSGAIPVELTGMQALKYMVLRENELSGKIPKELVQLKALKEVNLQKNRIIGDDLTLRRLLPNCTCTVFGPQKS